MQRLEHRRMVSRNVFPLPGTVPYPDPHPKQDTARLHRDTPRQTRNLATCDRHRHRRQLRSARPLQLLDHGRLVAIGLIHLFNTTGQPDPISHGRPARLHRDTLLVTTLIRQDRQRHTKLRPTL